MFIVVDHSQAASADLQINWTLIVSCCILPHLTYSMSELDKTVIVSEPSTDNST